MRTETFPLSLTEAELEHFNYRANIEGGTVQSLIRWKLGLGPLPKVEIEDELHRWPNRRTSKSVAEVRQDMQRNP